MMSTLSGQSPPLEQWQWERSYGKKGSGPGEFRNPEGIAADPGGFIYICDTGNHRIQKLDPDGVFLCGVGGFGWEKEQFDTPVSVDARNGLDIFVSDHNNHRIERYDKDLHYISSFRSQEEWEDRFRFGFPRDAALSNQGELFCLDGENRRVLKLDVMGEPQISFGGFDAGEGRLLNPRHLCITESAIFVTDESGIVTFDLHGNYVSVLGAGILIKPAGICWKPPDCILVLDAGSGKIEMFRTSGAYVGSCELRGGEGEPSDPVDLAVWRNRLLILDRSCCRVDQYRLLDGKE